MNKVFVWKNVLQDYSSGMMIAIASTVEEARAELLKECNYIPEIDLNKTPVEVDLSKPAAFIVWGGS